MVTLDILLHVGASDKLDSEIESKHVIVKKSFTASLSVSSLVLTPRPNNKATLLAFYNRLSYAI